MTGLIFSEFPDSRERSDGCYGEKGKAGYFEPELM